MDQKDKKEIEEIKGAKARRDIKNGDGKGGERYETSKKKNDVKARKGMRRDDGCRVMDQENKGNCRA